ncbi:MAG: hypothetical protein R3C19_04510 [Planctomycetaceae bacterium]
MLQRFADEKVEFLLVGGYAMAAHGHPGSTRNIDFRVNTTSENSSRVYTALARLSAPVHQIDEQDFAVPGNVFQIGVAPRRIDVISSIKGVDFPDCIRRAEIVSLSGVSVPVISRDDLSRNKRATGRPQDLVDAEILEKR